MSASQIITHKPLPLFVHVRMNGESSKIQAGAYSYSQEGHLVPLHAHESPYDGTLYKAICCVIKCAFRSCELDDGVPVVLSTPDVVTVTCAEQKFLLAVIVGGSPVACLGFTLHPNKLPLSQG